MPDSPTNQDITNALASVAANVSAMKAEQEVFHQDKVRRLDIIEGQVKYTNGRVTAMEKRWSDQDAVQRYKDSHDKRWQGFLAIVISIVSAIGAVIGALWWIKG